MLLTLVTWAQNTSETPPNKKIEQVSDTLKIIQQLTNEIDSLNLQLLSIKPMLEKLSSSNHSPTKWIDTKEHFRKTDSLNRIISNLRKEIDINKKLNEEMDVFLKSQALITQKFSEQLKEKIKNLNQLGYAEGLITIHFIRDEIAFLKQNNIEIKDTNKLMEFERRAVLLNQAYKILNITEEFEKITIEKLNALNDNLKTEFTSPTAFGNLDKEYKQIKYRMSEFPQILVDCHGEFSGYFSVKKVTPNSASNKFNSEFDSKYYEYPVLMKYKSSLILDKIKTNPLDKFVSTN